MAQPMVVVTCDRITHNILKWSGTPASYLEAAAHAGLLPTTCVLGGTRKGLSVADRMPP